MKKVSWMVNWTEDASAGRTSEVKVFSRLKDVVAFTEGKRGFILRHEDTGDGWSTEEVKVTFHSYFGGFVPHASTEAAIRHATRINPERGKTLAPRVGQRPS